MNTNPELVRHDEVTADWLTSVLRANGVEASVSSFALETVGTGQLGETRRFHLRFRDHPPPSAPASLVGKFHSDDDNAATTGRDMGLYRTEVMFYRKLAPYVGVHTPRAWTAAASDDWSRFVLLLDDLAPARAGNHMEGCDAQTARLALAECAALHAATWNDEALKAQPWVMAPEHAIPFYTQELLEACLAGFLADLGPRLEAKVREVAAAFVAAFERWNAPRDGHHCFAHGDFRADNLLIGGPRVAVVDWQTGAWCGAGLDVAYFLGGAFERDTRRLLERELLEHYHRCLVQGGVQDYPFEQLRDDYRHYTFVAVATAILASQRVKRTERGDRLFIRMASDAVWQALDNGADGLL